jgi:ABC-type hemin transport system ATPase subunit
MQIVFKARLEVRPGEFAGLVGNGRGKSTIVRDFSGRSSLSSATSARRAAVAVEGSRRHVSSTGEICAGGSWPARMPGDPAHQPP